MPLYEYRCPVCNNLFEELRAVKDRDSVQCPDCRVKADRKISLSRFKILDNFHKTSNIASDGEGFSSVVYDKQEARERIRANAKKYD